jgi:hypothetical protein
MRNQVEAPLTFQEFIRACLAPQWFAIVLTIVFVSGFLCQFTFFDRFGIDDSGDAFLKARYIQAGILIFLFPISILMPIVLTISLKHTELKERYSISAGDLVDLPGLVAELNNATHPLPVYVKNKLSDQTQRALAQYAHAICGPMEFKEELAMRLSKIIQKEVLYDDQRFANVDLRPETKELLAKSPRQNALIRLNKLLLEDAYPSVFAKAQRPFKFPYSTMAAFFNICAIFYLSLFTPRNCFFHRIVWVALIASLSFVGPLIIDGLCNTFILPRYRKLTVYLRWILLLTVIGGLDYVMFRGFCRQLRIIFWAVTSSPQREVFTTRLFPP